MSLSIQWSEIQSQILIFLDCEVICIILGLTKAKPLSSYPLPMHTWSSKTIKSNSSKFFTQFICITNNHLISIANDSSVHLNISSGCPSKTFVRCSSILSYRSKTLRIALCMNKISCKVSFIARNRDIKFSYCFIGSVILILLHFHFKIGLFEINIHVFIKKLLPKTKSDFLSMLIVPFDFAWDFYDKFAEITNIDKCYLASIMVVVINDKTVYLFSPQCI